MARVVANFISGPENTALAGFVGAAATSTLVTPAQKLAATHCLSTSLPRLKHKAYTNYSC